MHPGDHMFMYALYILIKQFGKNNELKFPVEETTPAPKDGVWSFGTKFEKETGNLHIYLVEGKEEIEKQYGPEHPASEPGTEEDKLAALRQKWLGEDSVSVHES